MLMIMNLLNLNWVIIIVWVLKVIWITNVALLNWHLIHRLVRNKFLHLRIWLVELLRGLIHLLNLLRGLIKLLDLLNLLKLLRSLKHWLIHRLETWLSILISLFIQIRIYIHLLCILVKFFNFLIRFLILDSIFILHMSKYNLWWCKVHIKVHKLWISI